LPAYSDLDFDGFPDADNDRDGQIDEDIGSDSNNDIASGIYLIDDDGDGGVDESGLYYYDDDEFSAIIDEDPVDGIDDDGDGTIDEDPPADANGDGCDGLCGVDDDGDGAIDESVTSDDDEDGASDEDWYDSVVFYLNGRTLRERTPVPWDETGAGGITGRDFLTSDIAENVTRLRFERVSAPGGGLPLIDITLELTSGSGEAVSLNRRVRVGGAL
ncbi:MAG: MSCRAMM family adhesin SdrC, partial [Gammaproteobacteria bacterium]|nr:MSCRAMM family adhesin SdrC [Gammaproteobacteria bacterium]